MRFRLSLPFGLIVVMHVVALATAMETNPETESKTIPLDQVWGYNLPGTRDVAGIPFPDHPKGIGQTVAFLAKERAYNIEQIRQALAIKPPEEQAAPGFVLQTELNSRALLAALQPLRGKPGFKQDFFEGEFTLVFFSHPLSYFARLRKVE